MLHGDVGDCKQKGMCQSEIFETSVGLGCSEIMRKQQTVYIIYLFRFACLKTASHPRICQELQGWTTHSVAWTCFWNWSTAENRWRLSQVSKSIFQICDSWSVGRDLGKWRDHFQHHGGVSQLPFILVWKLVSDDTNWERSQPVTISAQDFDNAKAKCQEAVTALEEKKRAVQGLFLKSDFVKCLW